MNVSVRTDVNKVFNVIRSSDGSTEVRSSNASIGERPLILNLGLTRHDDCWLEVILNEYLINVENIERVVSLTIPPDFSINLGDVITLQYESLILPVQINGVTRGRNETRISARSITVESIPITLSEHVSDGAGNYVSDGAGNYVSTGG